MMKQKLMSLVCLAACVLCLGGQSTCLSAAERVCDETFGEEEQRSFLDGLEDRILGAIDDALEDD